MVTRGGAWLKVSKRSTGSCLARDIRLDGGRDIVGSDFLREERRGDMGDSPGIFTVRNMTEPCEYCGPGGAPHAIDDSIRKPGRRKTRTCRPGRTASPSGRSHHRRVHRSEPCRSTTGSSSTGSRNNHRNTKTWPPATSRRSFSEWQSCFTVSGHALRTGCLCNQQGNLLAAARDPLGTDFREAEPVVESP